MIMPFPWRALRVEARIHRPLASTLVPEWATTVAEFNYLDRSLVDALVHRDRGRHASSMAMDGETRRSS
jgi:hypothetical protein